MEVKPDNDMGIDDKGQGEVKYAASADSATADTASSNTASTDNSTSETYAAVTAAAELPQKLLRGGRYAGGEMGRCRRERRRRRLETDIYVPDLQVCSFLLTSKIR